MVGDGAFSHKIDYIASKSHHLFKSYGNFAEWVDFAYWWGFIKKGLHMQPAQKACFYHKTFNLSMKSGLHILKILKCKDIMASSD